MEYFGNPFKNLNDEQYFQVYDYVQENNLLDELPLIGYYDFQKPLAESFLPGVHKNSYELMIVSKGFSHLRAGGEEYVLLPGQALMIQPSSIHESPFRSMEACLIYCARIKVPLQKYFNNISPEEFDKLNQIFLKGNRPFYVFPEVITLIDRILLCHEQKKNFSISHARACLKTLLYEVAMSIEDNGIWRKSQIDPRCLRMEQMILQDGEEKERTFKEIAKKLKIKESQATIIYKKNLSYLPEDLLIYQKLISVKKDLESTDLSITRISYDRGFSSSQYMATVFKNYFGITPLNYRKIWKENQIAPQIRKSKVIESEW